MIDLLGFVSGDNLFKYSFTLGVVMYAFSIIYPMGKKHELQLEKIKYYEDLQLLNFEIKGLRQEVTKTENEFSEILAIKDSIKRIGGEEWRELGVRGLKSVQKYDSLDIVRRDVNIRSIKAENLKRKVDTLQLQIDDFMGTVSQMKWVGFLLGSFGFIFWSISTFKDWGQPRNTQRRSP